jgi:hypothetical protein
VFSNICDTVFVAGTACTDTMFTAGWAISVIVAMVLWDVEAAITAGCRATSDEGMAPALMTMLGLEGSTKETGNKNIHL